MEGGDFFRTGYPRGFTMEEFPGRGHLRGVFPRGVCVKGRGLRTEGHGIGITSSESQI